ncbi:MAG: replication-relaxation family protein, partial [Pirellulales bacterium]
MTLQQRSLTARDVQLLAELGELGMMSAPMLLARRFTGFANEQSAQRSFRRRTKLFVALGLIDVTRVPLQRVAASSSLTMYRLTAAGADRVAELTGTRPRRAGSLQPLNPVTVPHRLGIVTTRLAFDDAHRQLGLPAPAWHFEYDQRVDAVAMATNGEKLVLYESFTVAGKRLVCWPDAAARIRLGKEPAHELLAYVEYDRSTESSRQIAAKSEPYWRLVRERRYLRHWPGSLGQHVVRVLFIVRSAERLQHVASALRDTPGAELFRLATYA